MDDSDQPRRLDDVNRPAWAEVAEQYAIEGWCDPGELGAFNYVADEARGLPVLELGVGGGRTVSLLRLLTSDYVGLDYTPELVEICRARHPDADVRVGDARDLSWLPPQSRALVVFTFNGIDSLGHEDRQLVLAGVHRVLRPGGIFLFSTLNKDNAGFGANPGTAPEPTWQPGSLLPAARRVAPAEGSPPDESWLTAVKNWRRLRGEIRDEGEWGVAPFGHMFKFVGHFITLPGAIAELDGHGFDVEAVFASDSPQVRSIHEPVDAMWMYLIARARH